MSYFYVSELSAGYGGSTVLENVSFSMERGELVGILGANGSGKTTLLKSICNLIPHQGRCVLNLSDPANASDGSAKPVPSVDSIEAPIELSGLSAKKLALCCSYIPQRSGISIDISVLDTVLMGFNPKLGLLEYPGSAMRKTALQMIELVGLSGKENANYQHLSEGQKQLCILARTFAADAALMLLDEPESALDFHYRHLILKKLKDWMQVHQRSAITTLHDPQLALNYCDKLILLSDKHVLEIIDPKHDSLKQMKSALSKIYGSIDLQICTTPNGSKRIVMLYESEEP